MSKNTTTALATKPSSSQSSTQSNSPSSSQTSSQSSFLHPGMLLPFILLVTCFAAWGLAANMTDPLVKVFGSVFSMGALQSSLVQFAYYGAYFCLALPAAYINSRLGYKGGVLVGLAFAALGGLLFFPASIYMTYTFFIVALFTLAGGLSILETSANPYVMAMGPEHNATRRLNFAQAFNPIGSNLGVLLAALFILPNVSPATPEERMSMSQAELLATRSEELRAVMGPYLSLAVLYIIIFIGIAVTKVPKNKHIMSDSAAGVVRDKGTFKRLLKNKNYTFGVIAQFFNVAAQTCIWTFTLHYVTSSLGVSDKVAGYWLQGSLIIFLVSRFLMVALMGRIDARKLMLFMCSLRVVLSLVAVFSGNIVGAICVVSMSACISLLFPTIYGISLKGLGDDTKFGAAGLVMAIIGGATIPMIQGRIIDATSPQASYIVVTICFSFIVAYALYTLKREEM